MSLVIGLYGDEKEYETVASALRRRFVNVETVSWAGRRRLLRLLKGQVAIVPNVLDRSAGSFMEIALKPYGIKVWLICNPEREKVDQYICWMRSGGYLAGVQTHDSSPKASSVILPSPAAPEGQERPS